jgi:hypothetical protein
VHCRFEGEAAGADGGPCEGDAMPVSPQAGRGPQVTRRPRAAGTRHATRTQPSKGTPNKFRCETGFPGLAPASSDAHNACCPRLPLPCLTPTTGAMPPAPGLLHGRCARCSGPGRRRAAREHAAESHAPTLPGLTARWGPISTQSRAIRAKGSSGVSPASFRGAAAPWRNEKETE